MSQDQSGALAIRLDDGTTVVAQPRPEDERRLADLLRGRTRKISLRASDADTEGHAALSEVIVDVEGHAFTLRVPSPADAAELRRRLLLGTLAATLAVAGAGAAIIGADVLGKSGSAPQAGAPVAAPAPLEDLSVRRENRLAPMESVGGPADSAAGSQSGAPSSTGPEQTNRQTRSGPLEFDR